MAIHLNNLLVYSQCHGTSLHYFVFNIPNHSSISSSARLAWLWLRRLSFHWPEQFLLVSGFSAYETRLHLSSHVPYHRELGGGSLVYYFRTIVSWDFKYDWNVSSFKGTSLQCPTKLCWNNLVYHLMCTRKLNYMILLL